MARMIPSSIDPRTPSLGEREAFARLRDDPNTQHWTVLHSLDLAQHVRHAQGEVDFVILVPGLGVLCLEVKAHHEIRVEHGHWLFGAKREPGRSPFRQSSEAMHSVRKRILTVIPSMKHVVFYSAVLFTHANLNISSAEWHPWQVIDGNRFRNAGSFGLLVQNVLEQARGFLVQQRIPWFDPSHNDPTAAQCTDIAQVLRPDFEATETPQNRAERLENEVMRFTTEQFVALDVMDANPRTVFAGPAGVGKTVLALEAARRSASVGRRVLVLCFNNLLGRQIKRQMEALAPNVTCTTLHAYCRGITGATVSLNTGAEFWNTTLPRLAINHLLAEDSDEYLFDEIILDEAQDLLRESFLDFLDLSLRGGLTAGRWRFFGDFERQAIYECDGPSLETIFAQRGIHAARYALRINCRNTPRIASTVEVITRLEPRYARTLRHDDGNEPAIKLYNSSRDQEDLLIVQLELLFQDGFLPAQIVVLSLRRDNHAVAARLNMPPWHNLLYPFANRQPGQIGFCSIHAFKGLEMDAVIVTDIERVNDDETVALLYVGLTRALHRLVVLVHDQAKSDILRLLMTKKETYG
jgi:hypothetical protein